jgi:hypothetical protein
MIGFLSDQIVINSNRFKSAIVSKSRFETICKHIGSGVLTLKHFIPIRHDPECQRPGIDTTQLLSLSRLKLGHLKSPVKIGLKCVSRCFAALKDFNLFVRLDGQGQVKAMLE